MLYRPEAFDSLSPAPWSESRVRDAIAEIVADADAAFDEEGLWPAEEWDAWSTPVPLKSLYVGAAGVVWALRALSERGQASSGLDLAHAARSVLEARRERPDLMAGVDYPSPRGPACSRARAAFSASSRSWSLMPQSRTSCTSSSARTPATGRMR